MRLYEDFLNAEITVEEVETMKEVAESLGYEFAEKDRTFCLVKDGKAKYVGLQQMSTFFADKYNDTNYIRSASRNFVMLFNGIINKVKQLDTAA